MALFSVFRLKPEGPLHIGERGIGLEASGHILHSDTLFSAICSIWRLMDRLRINGTETIYDHGRLQFSLKDPPFRISSAFPFINAPNVADVYFFPRPLSFRPGEPTEDAMISLTKNSNQRLATRSKAVKWVQLVSDGVLRSLIKGSSNKEALAMLNEGKVLLKQEEIERAMLTSSSRLWVAGHEGVRPRVTVDRLSSCSEVWFLGNIYFAHNMGLYFLFAGDEQSRQAVEEALMILQDEGIGGERTYGFGRFQLLPDSQISFDDTPSNSHLCLSLYHPIDGQEAQRALSNTARARVITRLGYFYSPDGATLRRRPVRMISEGSILAAAAKGDVVSVEPTAVPGSGQFSHPVYRYGLAFTVAGKFLSEQE